MKTIPRLHFAHLPTSVEPMPRLSAVLSGPRLIVKRDDQTGLAFGGNKARKLEFLLAEAQALGANHVVTAGALQSNHCRQTAAAAAHCGFKYTLVLYIPTSQISILGNEIRVEGNLLLDEILGANIVITSHGEREQALQKTMEELREAGEKPYLIPYGGSNPTGACAYAFALQEILEEGINPDWIVFPTSSGGTQAGLVVGARLYNFSGRILGISIDEPAEIMKERVARLAVDTAAFLGEDISFTPDEILVNAEYLGKGYGVMGAGEREAIRLFAQEEGILLDPVYTGRAAFGLLDLIRNDFFPQEQTVLFLHTGGTPALFTDQYAKAIL